ncbi:MAG TPA: glycosyltransferase [Patescibacteria group bacterium]|nr:glycosyltransferase [Patescibacteria group bacterium]
MKIGIDISQIVHEGTGVATYVKQIVAALVKKYPQHEYVLFGSSLRKQKVLRAYFNDIYHLSKHTRVVVLPIPPTFLEILWNRLHIFPVEWFTGPLDLFWSSDWTQPPLLRARGVTTIHDLSILQFPNESNETIVATQKRKLRLSARICSAFFCDSEVTKKDAEELLNIDNAKLTVVYPGL